MNGIYVFFASLAAVIFAYLSGRASRKKEVDTQKKKVEIAADVAEALSESSSEKGQIQADKERISQQIEQARQTNNLDAMGRIAADQAKIALERINK